MSTIEIIFLVILILLFAIIIFLIFRPKKPSNDINETLNRIEAEVKSNFGTLTEDQKKSIEKWTETLSKIGSNDERITDLKTQMEQLIKVSTSGQLQNAEKLTSTINKLEENLKNIDLLKTDVKDLNNIFFSTSKRGALGEFSLRSILINILGENSKIWKEQVQLIVESNTSGKGNADVVIYTGDGSENIVIDAKFPLDKYRLIEKIITDKGNKFALESAQKDFKRALSDKLHEIKKYISPQNKITNAILFVPSEAVFGYLISELPDIFEKSFTDHIWICSPTTLAAVLHTILQAQKDYELNRSIAKVKTIINDITNDYRLFNDRWEKVKNKILENQKEIKDLDITIKKIQDRQKQLDKYDIDDDEEK